MLMIDALLAVLSFAFTTIAVTLSPWLFGSWELWWFWSFVVIICLGSACFGLRLFLRAGEVRSSLRSRGPVVLALSFLPFLIYAFIRLVQSDVVFMDGEKTFLLFVTPYLLGLQIVFGFTRTMRRYLFGAVLVNLFLLGLYGIINHLITGSELVLWTAGYPNYYTDGRASGSYFCPDHYAGILEILLCVALGLVLARERRWPWKVAGLTALPIVLIGVAWSKSRGGGITLVVIAGAVLVWGFAQWSPRARWSFRACAAAALALGLIVFGFTARAYTQRFTDYFGWQHSKGKGIATVVQKAEESVMRSSRAHMIGGALRAWKTRPLTGIGPGMHQNLWPHFSAGDDGNRELGIRPTRRWPGQHSYKVHSDWVQLMEEHGLIGLVLFLIPTCVGMGIMMLAVAREGRTFRETGFYGLGQRHHLVLGGLLACTAMAFHSLGDFNLQMPGTTWTLTALVALAISASTPRTRASTHTPGRQTNR